MQDTHGGFLQNKAGGHSSMLVFRPLEGLLRMYSLSLCLCHAYDTKKTNNVFLFNGPYSPSGHLGSILVPIGPVWGS